MGDISKILDDYKFKSCWYRNAKNNNKFDEENKNYVSNQISKCEGNIEDGFRGFA